MFTRAKVLLPVSGIAVALLFGIVASLQRPTALQDNSPFVAPAIELCEAINAPATLLLGGLLLLAHSIHFELEFSRTPIPQIFFLVAVALLWFVMGLEVDQRLTKMSLAGHRVAAASVAIAVVVALVWFGVAAWRQEQATLTLGCAAWSTALALFYCIDLARLWRVQAK
ncbi:MAG: hypothetical protein WBV55_14440 [Candidatus Sulfotelmatobacter sp.]